MKTTMPKLALAAVSLSLLLAACGERPAADGGTPAQPAVAGDTPAAASGPQFTSTSEVGTLMALEARATCSLENVVDLATQTPSPGSEPNTYRANRAASYRLIGFATDSEAGTLPSATQLMLHGAGKAYTLPAQGGLERSDVAAFFKKPTLANAGYQADAGFANVQPGTYEVFAVNTFDGKQVLCPTHQSIIID
jgi:hypothetical protein